MVTLSLNEFAQLVLIAQLVQIIKLKAMKTSWYNVLLVM